MTTTEITTKVRRMKRLQAKAEQLQAEITAIQDEIKATMTEQGAERRGIQDPLRADHLEPI